VTTVGVTILQKHDLSDFVSRLLPHYRVVGPVVAGPPRGKGDGRFAFDVITDPASLRLEYTTTILPPKKYLLPPHEVLFEFDRAGNGVRPPAPPARPTVIFGVHTCDLHAIQLLDEVFASGCADSHYLDRRRQTLIVSVECLTPCDEHSFCKSMGTLTADEGYDLHLTDLGEAYAVDLGTPAGRDLLTEYARTREAAPGDLRRLNAVLSEKWPKFPYRLDFDISDLPSLLSLSMKSPLWNELGERCLACAACTNVCPTCFCFDVKDEVELDLRRGRRVRVWDSCQLDEFATVAGGHNFRKSRALRQRHRFLRKGKYILEAHGRLGCVGCGRCARACLVNITPVGVFNELYGQQQMASKS
jgi:formate hydrogenlyase subunit 6/NADH:ubiquinone oxidoreductase subunit I